MSDMENIIKGLESCSSGDTMPDCENCPMNGPGFGFACRDELRRKALHLLKEQEEILHTLQAECGAVQNDRRAARLLSLDDIMEIYNTRESHIWPHDTAPYMFVEEHPDIHTYHGSWTAWREIMAILHDGIFIHTRNTYGKTWRCWTSRPTDEQREKVEWE